MNTDSLATRFGSGRAVRRLEDDALLRGRGKFTDDVIPQDQLVMQFLRSPYPHARILSMDSGPARSMPGVVAVYTGADLVKAGVAPMPGVSGFPRPDGSPAVSPVRHPLTPDIARFVGEPLAAVVAQTREQARDALEAIVVEYEELPSVTEVEPAVAGGSPLLMPEVGDNVSAELRHGDAAASDKAFSAAAQVARVSIVNQRVAASPIEPRTTLVEFDPGSGRLTARLSSQMPTGARETLGTVLGMEKEEIRVVVGDVGGGFGMKTGLYPEDAVVAFAARDLKQPVKWVADRSEELLSSAHGRDVRSEAELALDANGRVLALRVRSLANVGAYATGVGVAIQLLIGPWVSTSIYDISTIDLKFTAVMTNTAPTGAYRGAGRPEAIYLIERLMDEAARLTGLSRTEIRRRNMIRPEQLPYKNPMEQTYDSGKFESVMDQGLALADWDGFDRRLVDSQSRGRLRGIGIATFLEWTGGNVFEERVTVRVAADGFIEIVSALQAMGQGIVTSFAQLAVDVFGIPIEKIRIVQGDTDLVTGFGSAGSRSLFTGGSSVQIASQRTIEKAKTLAAEELEVAEPDVEYHEGLFRVVGTDRQVGIFDLASRQPDTSIYVDSTSTVGGPTWPNGCHICEAEIDPETGKVEIVSYASANDVGHAVNPMIVTGQLEGGAVQGIGQALCEEVVYDRESAQLLTGSFMDYAIPRADILAGPISTVLDQSSPCLLNPLGVKGVGELGTIGATPAVVSAVVDALSRAGHGNAARTLQMPLTDAKVWGVLNAPA